VVIFLKSRRNGTSTGSPLSEEEEKKLDAALKGLGE
jgi:hypothetical protein